MVQIFFGPLIKIGQMHLTVKKDEMDSERLVEVNIALVTFVEPLLETSKYSLWKRLPQVTAYVYK